MDRTDVEIEEEEDGVGKSSWAAAVLRRSWWFGKRFAIAGAAITSAPVVIPPLFVLSTLGLAFSFPFGIYLVSYACADKIMSVLLPLPPLKEEDEKESMESEDLVVRGFDIDQRDEMVLDEENWEKGEILEGEREGGGGGLLEFGFRNGLERPAVELGVESGEKIREEEEIVEMIREEEEIVESADHRNVTAAEVEELRKSDFANSAKGVRQGVQQREEVREGVTAASESSGSPKSPYTVVVMGTNEESKKENEPPYFSLEHLSVVELRGKGKANETLAMKELREEGGEEEKRLRVSNDVVAKDKELAEECRSEIEPPRLKPEYVLSAVIVPSKDADAENLEKSGSMEHRSLVKPAPAAVVAVCETGLRSHDEFSNLQRTHEEEQLWYQIFSMRTIVGYQATLQPSLGEELMALYLLIGVEPPVSLKDSADLVEINSSLQFLKSVVGVK